MGVSRRGITQDLARFVKAQTSLSDVRVAYQPIVDLGSGDVFAHEALLRSTDPNSGGPPEMIAAALQSESVGELGRLIRELAIEGCPDAPLFLNIHPAEFEYGWLVRPDDPIYLHESPIYIELTESVPMSHAEWCQGSLQEMRGKGIAVVIDDLGAGYSNLKYIVDLEPEVVKLDRELITNLHQNPRGFTLVRTLVQLCEDLGAKVVGEGIETAEELDAVREAGVHLGQGYFIARPASPPPTPFAEPA